MGKDAFRGKKVLELGSGTGMLFGFVIALLMIARSRGNCRRCVRFDKKLSAPVFL